MKHKFEKNNKYFTICVYLFTTVILCIIVGTAIGNLSSVKEVLGTVLDAISPFIIGMFIAYLINPIPKFINSKILKPICRGKFKKFRKVTSVLLSYVIVITAISMIIFYIVPEVADTVGQIGSLVNSAQNGYNNIIAKIESFENKHPNIDLEPVMNVLETIPKYLAEILSSSIPTIVTTLLDKSVSFVSGIFDFIIAIIVSIYMLLDKTRIMNTTKKILYAFLGDKKGDIFIREAGICNGIFANFVVGKAIDSLIIGIMCYFLMKIAGLPYELIVSIIVGITNMIPYFGPFIGAIPGVLLLLLVDFSYGLVFAILILALQQFDGLYLGPKILGESTGIRPMWIIFAITVGGFVAGPLGMFLGVPTVAVIMYLFDKLFDKKLHEKGIEFEEDEETGALKRKEKKRIEKKDTSLTIVEKDDK